VPSPASPPQKVLLAYDNSPKAKEGLFVAAYMASSWPASLTVLTVSSNGNGHIAQETLGEAQRYLEQRQVEATYLSAQGHVAETILMTANQQDSNLIIMGGYGTSPIREAVVGTNLDQVLHRSSRSVLICR
jgi:nucleotide-binding universal stress UspA family protein